MSVLAPERTPMRESPGDRVPVTDRARKKDFAGLVLAVPFAVLLVCTVLVPVLYALYLSLFTERLQGLGFSGPEHVFVWLGNYLSVIADSAFHASLGNVALFATIHIPSMLIGSLVLALLLDSGVVRLKQMWSLAVFVPYAVPVVIGGLIWAYLYSPTLGPIKNVLGVDPLSDGALLPSIANIATWQWVGYNMIIFYTALQAVPKEIVEAARADGAAWVPHRVVDQDPGDPADDLRGDGVHRHRLVAGVHRTHGAQGLHRNGDQHLVTEHVRVRGRVRGR